MWSVLDDWPRVTGNGNKANWKVNKMLRRGSEEEQAAGGRSKDGRGRSKDGRGRSKGGGGGHGSRMEEDGLRVGEDGARVGEDTDSRSKGGQDGVRMDGTGILTSCQIDRKFHT